MPYKWIKPFMLSLGVFSLLMSLVSYFLCMMVYSGSYDDLRPIWFGCLLVKALTWSPFLGIEFYDTIFEHIYYDV